MANQVKARRNMVSEPVMGQDGKIHLVTLERGQTAEVESMPVASAVELKEKEHGLQIFVDGTLFTEYIYDPAIAKPYLGPIFNSLGESFTRLDLTAKEHPHQRSLIIAVGEVNGIDFWNEPANCGFQRHQGFRDLVQGEGFAAFTADNVWVSHEGNPVVNESRRFTFYGQDSACRYVDVEVTFTAAYGKVEFGATKEAGPLGIRAADALRQDRGAQMINAYGAEGEEECWGRSAPWCCFAGELSGQRCGIAIFDHEDNERYPTAWHARAYGLFAANNLYFKGGLTIEEGQSLTYRWRVLFFEGDCDAAGRFLNYAK